MGHQPKNAWPVFKASGAVSVAIRTGEPEEKIAELRRDLRAAQLERYVREIIAKAPPLTEAQRDRIATLLKNGPDSVPLEPEPVRKPVRALDDPEVLEKAAAIIRGALARKNAETGPETAVQPSADLPPTDVQATDDQAADTDAVA